jgi:hypothetical protein
MKTQAHTLIEKELNWKLSTLSPEDLKIYEEWEQDQSDYLVLSDSAMADELEKWTLAYYEVKQLEKDSSDLDSLKDSLKHLKKISSFLEYE